MAAIPECHVILGNEEQLVGDNNKVLEILVNTSQNDINISQAIIIDSAYRLVKQQNTQTKEMQNIQKLIYKQPEQS